MPALRHGPSHRQSGAGLFPRLASICLSSFPSDGGASPCRDRAEFAGAAGLFWAMHGALFENQSILSIPTIFTIAEKLRLPEVLLRNALETGQYADKVRSDFMSGVRSGVNGTPAFFINGVRHDGPYDFASLASAIQLRLAAESPV